MTGCSGSDPRLALGRGVARVRWLDLGYWFVVTPFVTGSLTRLSTIAAIGLLAMAVPRPLTSFGFWVELPLALLLADLVGYWSHRLRHKGVLWCFHVIHHSPTKLDALAAARMHPIDDMIDNTLVGIALFAAGLSAEVIFALGPILYCHIALTHADVAWDGGRLRKILVFPAHHRAHHELDQAGNYAGMFSFLDTIFGTAVQGQGRPHGCAELIPESLIAHLTWPLHALLKRKSIQPIPHPCGESTP